MTERVPGADAALVELLAAAERAGYDRAVANLRDGNFSAWQHERYEQNRDDEEVWYPDRALYAEWLESLATKETDR